MWYFVMAALGNEYNTLDLNFAMSIFIHQAISLGTNPWTNNPCNPDIY